MKETYCGIEYTLPQVILLQDTGIGTSSFAARTCYDSFQNDENEAIVDLNGLCTTGEDQFRGQTLQGTVDGVNDIEHSKLLDDLAWTYFHHSILEHSSLTYLMKGTSRGVLQEHARHRIQAISVRSTRYTGSSVINAFVASQSSLQPRAWFADKILMLDMFVTSDALYNRIEADGIYSKLMYQQNILGKDEFNKLAIAKSSLHILDQLEPLSDAVYEYLQEGKKKRNALDPFKNIVTDTWKVDMVVTFNLRSLKNYFTLRDSGAAYKQIQWLAREMKKITPSKYLDLIVKKEKEQNNGKK